MMLPYSKTLEIPRFPLVLCKPRRGKSQWICDATISFDTETTTYFLVNGEWKTEKYTTQQERRDAADALGIVYVWACRMPGLTVYGRTREELAHFIYRLDKVNPARKIIWVHNLNYDYSFLSDIMIPDYTDSKAMLSRAKMSPLKVKLSGYNIELRDSYALCNMSLQTVAKAYKLGEKLKGDLDYTEAHLPNTPLTFKQLCYVERDVDILYEYIEKEWISRHGRNWLALPYTQTGVPRQLCKDLLTPDKKHMKHMQNMKPKTVEEYENLHDPFSGGVAHANYLYVSDDADNQMIVKDVTSADRASSYPTEMVTRKFPCTKFVKMENPLDVDIYSEDYVYICLVKYVGLQQRTAWDYISYSKCKSEPKNAKVDNGRIASADEVVIKVTNIDMRVINNVYTYNEGETKILEAYVAKADYLPLDYVNLVLDLYGDKTKLKNSNPDVYLRSKQILNSLYGLLVQDICKENVNFIDGVWSLEYDDKTEDEVARLMVGKLKKSNPFLPYSVGVFVTAYAREQLFEPILHFDGENLVGIANDTVYTDTDSVKFIHAAENMVYIEAYNKRMIERLHRVADDRGISYERFAPLDEHGEAHPLGVFEADGFYDEFVTMGSKKYCYHKKKKDGTFEFGFVVAGLQKSYVDQSGEHQTMQSMAEMRPGVHIKNGRTNYIYSVEQQKVELTDYLGNKYVNDYERGVAMWRTDYTFSLSRDYSQFLDDPLLDLWVQKCFNRITSPLAQVAKWRTESEVI